MTTDTNIQELIRRFRQPEPVYVTRPSMPDLVQYCGKLEGIWQRRWLTNEGCLHQELEERLCRFLGVQHLNLFCNGTIGLLVALQALQICGGEVITTPFTFPATPHVLWWNRIRPVFCDIDPVTCNLDPARIEEWIGPETRAILAVHVYGTPCDVEAIQKIADRHGLAVIYDAAHAFGVRHLGRSVLEYGDLSMLSFHATKLFSTAEGGALVSRTAERKQRINFLKNFGIADEQTVIDPGINGKMNELSAAYGLLQLDMVAGEIRHRRAVADAYRQHLAGVPGLRLLPEPGTGTESNYAYFPVFVDAQAFGLARDALHDALKAMNILTRRYFHPLCSTFPCYSGLPASAAANLPAATRAANEVLCLPIYGTLALETVQTICRAIRALAERQ